MSPIQPEELDAIFQRRLRQAAEAESDVERLHVECDFLLCHALEEAGLAKTAAEFRELKQERGFWYA